VLSVTVFTSVVLFRSVFEHDDFLVFVVSNTVASTLAPFTYGCPNVGLSVSLVAKTLSKATLEPGSKPGKEWHS